eukprot:CAMPEP_0198464624 /NCGR_PEP_ID=MMETSP1456-20131121/2718_1 /TAXON_ID=1461544 ORGANISM="Unidentified sp., Strain RCC1871" /NCGR_SAMPLE_ID=MMETSP1456 /ASSEMBLY_ACC=CAM_ASM_001119 /LENGTH=562 /DNA_ID=CAMNT_0044190349 /DNA_START=78 /DNA_END=1763 /DNA_ORIENTATION=+
MHAKSFDTQKSLIICDLEPPPGGSWLAPLQALGRQRLGLPRVRDRAHLGELGAEEAKVRQVLQGDHLQQHGSDRDESVAEPGREGPRDHNGDREGEEPDGPERGQGHHRGSELAPLLAPVVSHQRASQEDDPQHDPQSQDALAWPMLVVVELAELIVVPASHHLEQQVERREDDHEDAAQRDLAKDAPRRGRQLPCQLPRLWVPQQPPCGPGRELHDPELTPARPGRRGLGRRVRHLPHHLVQANCGPPARKEDQQEGDKVLAGPLRHLRDEVQGEEGVPPPQPLAVVVVHHEVEGLTDQAEELEGVRGHHHENKGVDLLLLSVYVRALAEQHEEERAQHDRGEQVEGQQTPLVARQVAVLLRYDLQVVHQRRQTFRIVPLQRAVRDVQVKDLGLLIVRPVQIDLNGVAPSPRRPQPRGDDLPFIRMLHPVVAQASPVQLLFEGSEPGLGEDVELDGVLLVPESRADVEGRPQPQLRAFRCAELGEVPLRVHGSELCLAMHDLCGSERQEGREAERQERQEVGKTHAAVASMPVVAPAGAMLRAILALPNADRCSRSLSRSR